MTFITGSWAGERTLHTRCDTRVLAEELKRKQHERAEYQAVHRDVNWIRGEVFQQRGKVGCA